MRQIVIHNPFGAPVFHEETVGSTMDVSRSLAVKGRPHGTVIAADFQETGRGRIRERSWEAERGQNLIFTILLRYPCIEEIPTGLTLRAGLAVALAVEDFFPSLSGRVKIKWPNDVLIVPAGGEAAKKLSGILAEADGGNVHLGIGINVAQKEFPAHLRDTAASISLAIKKEFTDREKSAFLEKVLQRLHDEIAKNDNHWRERLARRLYGKGDRVCFAPGAADTGKKVTGTLAGIGEGGELLIIPDGETGAQYFITGELRGILL